MSTPTPPWLAQVQFIRFYIANPCDFGLQVYFETAWPGTSRLAINIVAFGLLDLVRGFFRPAGLRRGRHGRKARRRRGGRETIPEVANEIARRLPGYTPTASRQVSDGVRHLWSVDSWGQKWFYRIFVVGLITDFWFDWNSTIVKDPRSSCPDIGRGMRRDPFKVNLAGGWGVILANDVIYNHAPVDVGIGSTTVGVGDYMIVVSAKANIFHPELGDSEVQLGVTPTNDLENFLAVSSRYELSGFQVVELIATAYIQGPGQVTHRAYVSGEPIAFHDIEVFCMQMSDRTA